MEWMRISNKHFFTFLFFFVVAICSNAQEALTLADTAFARNEYQKAVQLYRLYEKQTPEANRKNNENFAHGLWYAGKCYYFLDQTDSALFYFKKALPYYRELKLWNDIGSIHTNICETHAQSRLKNLKWTTPKIINETVSEIYFKITSVKYYGKDSIAIEVNAGSYDGVIPGIDAQCLGAIKKDKTTERTGWMLASAKVAEVKGNNTLLKARLFSTDDTLRKVYVGDVAALYCKYNKNKASEIFQQLTALNIALLDNYRTQLYEWREFMDADSAYEQDLYEILKINVHEIYEMLHDDPDYDALYCNEGLFKNTKLFTALNLTTAYDIRAFLQFVKHFPGKYAGMYYKFAETYATWIINNCPSSALAFTDYYLHEEDASKRLQYIKNYEKEIKKDNYFEAWKNEILKDIRQNNLGDIPLRLEMLKSSASLINKPGYPSWAAYCEAKYFQKVKDTTSANKQFRSALKGFAADNLTEGMSLCKEALKQKQDNQKVEMVLQNGHAGYFGINFSPDGKYFVSAGDDKKLKLWDARLGKEILTISAHKDNITSASFSYDGRFIISGSLDQTVKIWDSDNLTLIAAFEVGIPVSSVLLSKNGDYFIISGKDSVIQYWDITSKKQIKQFRKHKRRIYDLCEGFDENEFYSCGADSIIYKWDIEKNEMLRWYREKDRIIHVGISPDGRWMYNTLANGKLDLWDLNTNKSVYFFDNLKSYALDSSGSFYICKPSFSKDSRYLIYGAKNSCICIMELATGNYITYRTSHFMDILEIDMSPDGKFFATIGKDYRINLFDFENYIFDMKFNFRIIKIEGLSDGGGFVAFGAHNSLLINGTRFRKFELSSGKSETLIDYTNAPAGIKNIYNTNKTALVYLDHYHRHVLRYYFENRKLDTIYTSDFEIKDLDYDFESDALFVYQENDELIKSVSKKTVATIKANLPDSSCKGLLYNHLSKQLFLAGYTTIGMYNADLLFSKNYQNVSDTNLLLVASASNNYFASSGEKNSIKIFDAKGNLITMLSQTASTEKMIFSLTISPNDSLIIVGYDDGVLQVWDWRNHKLLHTNHNHSMFIQSVAISDDGKFVATSSFDSRIILYQLNNMEVLCSLYPMYDKGILSITPDNYYLSPRSCYDGFVFRMNKQIYTPEQFDLQFHRPDLVIKKIGTADEDIINAYHAAYIKRAKRNGLDTNQASLNLQLPAIEIENKENLPITSTQNTLKFKVTASDLQYNLKAIRVWVNNIPVFGVLGMPVKPTQDIKTDISVTLQNGKNSIKVAAVNEKGVESLKEYYQIFCNYKDTIKPNLYIVVISVSKYKDASYNLTYAAKDGRDLIDSFKNRFPKVIIDSFINENAILEKILTVKQKLKRSNVNDKVIVFVSGHGLLDEHLNFYFATHDIDFKHPERRGISYEQINDLLDDIPARQKLLLMDACHSGEIDKDAAPSDKKPIKDTTTAVVQDFAKRGSALLDDSKVGLQNSFELMQDLFSDLSNGNGAVVISAASGTGYALESATWKNGVFTYAILNGLCNKKADADKDYSIKISELSDYISQEVKLQTNGKQKPTSRAENIEYDWEVW